LFPKELTGSLAHKESTTSNYNTLIAPAVKRNTVATLSPLRNETSNNYNSRLDH